MNRIKELREAKNIQQKELAVDLGVTQPTISNWELGIKVPSAKSTLKLADYFGVSVDYLLGRDSGIDYNDLILSPANLSLFGEETEQSAPEDGLSEDALALARAFDEGPESMREAMRAFMKMYEEAKNHLEK